MKKPVFVIQKHDASSLHSDFRLEIVGALKSLAIPKGVSTDPAVRRLAIPTDDHPLEYDDFEGVIPAGQGGAGAVMPWDRGVYRNLRQEMKGDAALMRQSYDEGKLEVELDGEKIKGGYALTRTGSEQGERWLLVKMDDSQADARRRPKSTEVRSVQTDRTMTEIHDKEIT